ncbi:hypothetical protein T310_8799, partial [Rasamsonia emersonii CBS 393.64]
FWVDRAPTGLICCHAGAWGRAGASSCVHLSRQSKSSAVPTGRLSSAGEVELAAARGRTRTVPGKALRAGLDEAFPLRPLPPVEGCLRCAAIRAAAGQPSSCFRMAPACHPATSRLHAAHPHPAPSTPHGRPRLPLTASPGPVLGRAFPETAPAPVVLAVACPFLAGCNEQAQTQAAAPWHVAHAASTFLVLHALFRCRGFAQPAPPLVLAPSVARPAFSFRLPHAQRSKTSPNSQARRATEPTAEC